MEFTTSLPSFYQKNVENLLQDLSASNDMRCKRKLLNEYSKKYTVIPDIWLYWEKLETPHCDFDSKYVSERCCKIRWQAYKHFYWEDSVNNRNEILNPYRRTLNLPYFQCIKNEYELDYSFPKDKKYIAVLKEILTFPNSNLKTAMELYKIYSASPIDPRMLKCYSIALQLYEKIIAAEKDDDEEWLKLLMESENEKFVCDNIECRLGKDPFNVKIWQSYIAFLHRKNDTIILNIYRRYCRLFINDKPMQECYKNQIIKFNDLKINVNQWFIDIIKIERDFGTIDKALNLLIFALNSSNFKSIFKFAKKFGKKYEFMENIGAVIEKNKKRIANPVWQENVYPALPITVDQYFLEKQIGAFYKNIVFHQNFVFPSWIMSYITSKASFNIYNNLLKSCKYFFLNQNMTLIWDLKLEQTYQINFILEFLGDSLYALAEHPIFDSLKKIWIGHAFYFVAYEDPMCLSNFLPKLHCMDIEYLTIKYQTLTRNEYFLITSSSKIRKVSFDPLFVYNEDMSSMSLEEALNRFPNAYYIEWCTVQFNHITAETTKHLSMQKRNKKLMHLQLSFNDLFDPIYFCEYLKDNAAANAQWLISIKQRNVNEEYKNLVQSTIKNACSQWPIPEEAPDVAVMIY